MKKWQVVACALPVIATGLLANAPSAHAAGTNWDHELMVYTLEQYEPATDHCNGDLYAGWKHSIPIEDNQDPYVGLWNTLYTNCGTGAACAKASDSVRR